MRGLHAACHLGSVGLASREQPWFLAVAATDESILRTVEDGESAAVLHELLALGEAGWTVGHHASVVPVYLNLRHAHLGHVVACRERELHVLCLRSACVEQQSRRAFHVCGVAEVQCLEGLVQDVASHVAQRACTVVPPSAPVPGLIEVAVWVELGRACEEIPVESARYLVCFLGSVESLGPDRTVGGAVYACHLTDLTVPYPVAHVLCAVP